VEPITTARGNPGANLRVVRVQGGGKKGTIRKWDQLVAIRERTGSSDPNKVNLRHPEENQARRKKFGVDQSLRRKGIRGGGLSLERSKAKKKTTARIRARKKPRYGGGERGLQKKKIGWF